MAKCRNCCKEVDPNATICPYCQTGMPANDFIAKVKGILIGLIGLALLCFLVYQLFSSVISYIDSNLWVVMIFVFGAGIIFFVLGVLGFIGIKLEEKNQIQSMILNMQKSGQ